jgi:L-arabinokinase
MHPFYLGKWQTVPFYCFFFFIHFFSSAAAAGAGIPAAIASNFTFDEVYTGLCEGDALDDDIHTLVQRVIADYRHADLLIRLPGAIRIPSFDDTVGLVPHTPHHLKFPEVQVTRKGVANGKLQLPCTSVSNIQHESPDISTSASLFLRRIIDVPLVFRKYNKEREEVLEAMGIPRDVYENNKVLLLSFGGQLLGGSTWGNPLPEGWVCIVCAAPDAIEMPDKFYHAPKDAYVPDLTNACDVLLGKLGYGTCSECIGHQTPFVYVPRPQFIEEQGLLKLMKDQGSAVELTREAFEAGQWADAIERASKMPGTCKDPQQRVSHNGGEIAATNLEHFVIEWNKQKYADVSAMQVKQPTNLNPLPYPTQSVYISVDR